MSSTVPQYKVNIQTLQKYANIIRNSANIDTVIPYTNFSIDFKSNRVITNNSLYSMHIYVGVLTVRKVLALQYPSGIDLTKLFCYFYGDTVINLVGN